MRLLAMAFLGGVATALSAPAGAAEPVMVQCGREYQAARTAGTLNGMDWNAYRTACAERLKAGAPATATAPPAAVAAATPSTPASAATGLPATSLAPAASGGMAAMHARQRQCGAEWRADKAKLLAQTPGLTWPKYWSQCNTRLKAAGG